MIRVFKLKLVNQGTRPVGIASYLFCALRPWSSALFTASFHHHGRGVGRTGRCAPGGSARQLAQGFCHSWVDKPWTCRQMEHSHWLGEKIAITRCICWPALHVAGRTSFERLGQRCRPRTQQSRSGEACSRAELWRSCHLHQACHGPGGASRR